MTLLKINVSELPYNEERIPGGLTQEGIKYWLNLDKRGCTASLEIHRLWIVQHYGPLLPKSRQTNTKKIRT